MKILLDWLKEFVAADIRPEQVANDLTMTGTKVEAVTEEKGQTVFELDLTTNRPDCMSHYGVAREVATIYGVPLKPVAPVVRESAEPASSMARVEIADPDLCTRYVGLVIRGVKVQPSPDWLRKPLEALGLSSINNVVDATNYVLLELGHPLHAFDLDTLAERRIIVRRARAGEHLRTLDGADRTLAGEMLVIADAARPVALAGIMGGEETEISFRSRNVLLESAWFNPVSIRKTSKALGLRTEASARFERGADVEMALDAARRCSELMVELAGGEVLAGAIDVYLGRATRAAIDLRRSEILRVMGEDIPDEHVESILTRLGFAVARRAPGHWRAVPPSWRLDVTAEIDLIEEVARHYGYDKFPVRLPAARQPLDRLPTWQKQNLLSEALRALGYDETIAFSLVDPEEDVRFGMVPPLELANPLSAEVSVMRTTGLVSMVQSLRWNLNRGQKNVRLFEIGKAYFTAGSCSRERSVLTLGATGQGREKTVHDAPRTFDLYDLKGAVEAVLGLFAGEAQFVACDAGYLDPAGRVRALLDGTPVAVFGRLSRDVANAYKFKQDTYLAEFDLQALDARELRPLRYRPISRFPAIERDFSLLLDEATPFSAVRQAIEKLAIAEIRDLRPLDRFRDPALGTGKYSLLLRVVFQSAEGTLTDQQVNGFSQRIIYALRTELGATLRA